MVEAVKELKQLVVFSLPYSLSDIPEGDTCYSCGNPEQREFLEFESETDITEVVGYRVPGYGCTGCSLKGYNSAVLIETLGRAANSVATVGDTRGSQHFKREMFLVERTYFSQKT